MDHIGRKIEKTRIGRTLKKIGESKFFSRKFSLLEWPPCSPDLNPIENIWGILKSKVWSRFPRTVDELWKVAQEEWDLIPQQTIQSLIESMTNRVRSANRGGTSKYWMEQLLLMMFSVKEV